MDTAPTLIAARIRWGTFTTSRARPRPWPRARNVRYVGALSRNDESAPAAQKNCQGWRTPSSPPRVLKSSSAGIIVRKMPKKRTATSTIGYAVKPLARRIWRGVRQSETAARPTMTTSRQDREEHTSELRHQLNSYA